MKKKNTYVNEFKKLASLSKKIGLLDSRYSKIEGEFLSIFNKLNKSTKMTKRDRQKFYSNYRQTLNNRLKRFKKGLKLT